VLPPGALNAITDVAGVLVGHVTVIEGDPIRTGATAILPHAGNLYRERVPAGIVVSNSYGKLMGSTQVHELGEIETPIVLTNTLAVPRAADAILDWTLADPANHDVVSINPLVGETNDSYLEEAIYNSLCMAETVQGYRGLVGHALPLDQVRALLRSAGVRGAPAKERTHVNHT
jgi:D-aminopeptidase